MSKEKSLSLPENLWLRPPPSQSLSFVSISPFLPTTISSLNPAELLGEVWVGMDPVQAWERPWRGHGEAMERFSTTDSDTARDLQDGILQAYDRVGGLAMHANSGGLGAGSGVGG